MGSGGEIVTSEYVKRYGVADLTPLYTPGANAQFIEREAFRTLIPLVPARSEGLNEGLKSVLEHIKLKPGIQAKELSVILQRSIKTIERQIKALTDLNLIRREGSRKTGGYFKN